MDLFPEQEDNYIKLHNKIEKCLWKIIAQDKEGHMKISLTNHYAIDNITNL